MKSSIIHRLVAIAISASSAAAFVPPTRGAASSSSSSSSSLRMSKGGGRLAVTPEIEAAITDVRAAAAEFGEEAAYFANAWIDKTIEGSGETTAAGLLDECILDDDGDTGKCERFENALSRLVGLLGVGVGEQY